MPVRASSSMARARAAFGRIASCSSSTSPIWLPTVYSGFSAVIGSWKIIAMRLPRRPRIWRSLLASRSSPSKRIAPLVVALSTSRSTDSAVIDLPEPDSPTSANFSPARDGERDVVDDGAVAEAHPQVLDFQQRCAHDLRVSKASRSASPMKVSSSSVSVSAAKVGHDDPPGVEVALALAHQVAQRGRAGRHAQAQEVQRHQRQDRVAHAEGQEGDDRRHRVRQHVAPDDLAVRSGPSARAAFTNSSPRLRRNSART